MTAVVAAVLALCAAVYVAGLLCFALGVLRPRRPPPAGADPPSVAVVVAARDEAGVVEACLEALCSQSHPAGRYEVILVDDGSGDGTGDLARAAARRLEQGGPRVRGPRRSGPLRPGRLQEGGSRPGHRRVRCRADTHHRRRLPGARHLGGGHGRRFAADVGAVVAFSQIGPRGALKGLLPRWEALDFLQLMTAAAGSCALGRPMAASGQSLGFRRAAYEQVGGYRSIRHRVSGDDVLLLQLIRRAGCCASPSATTPAAMSSILRLPASGAFSASASGGPRTPPSQGRLDPAFFAYILGPSVCPSG